MIPPPPGWEGAGGNRSFFIFGGICPPNIDARLGVGYPYYWERADLWPLTSGFSENEILRKGGGG